MTGARVASPPADPAAEVVGIALLFAPFLKMFKRV